MAKKRVHEIAKERGITSKEALQVLQQAGLKVTAAASSVEETDAARAFGNGAAPNGADQTSAPAAEAPAAVVEAPPAPAPASEAPAATTDESAGGGKAE